VKDLDSVPRIEEMPAVDSQFVELSDAMHAHLRSNLAMVVSWLNNTVPLPANETVKYF